MASIRTLLARLYINTETVSALRALGHVQKNGMSQYPKYYIKPFPKKETQQALVESGEAQKLLHVPTRAALMDQSSSYRQNDLINLFTNYVMRDGNKLLARMLVQRSFTSMKRIQMAKYWKCEDLTERQTIELDPRVIFFQAIENCKPLLNLMPIKRGGVRYQVPVPITEKQQQFLSMKWLIKAAIDKDKKKEKVEMKEKNQDKNVAGQDQPKKPKKVKTRKKDEEPREHTRFYDRLAVELINAYENKGSVIEKKRNLHKMCEANRAYAHYRWS